MDSTDDPKFAEELGDLLLQVLFHAQIANEEGRFSIADVIREIYEKMIRRHPHVFGEKRAKDAAEVLRNWEIIKREERAAKSGAPPVAQGESASPAAVSPSAGSTPPNLQGDNISAPEARHTASQPESLLDGVPRTLPALLEALQLTRKAARIGFDWDSTDGIFDKLDEETRELRHALAQPHGTATPGGVSSTPPQTNGARKVAGKGLGGRSFSSDNKPSTKGGASAPEEMVLQPSIESELGDLLFVAVNLARFLHVDPEIALKKASAKFSRRFREMERLAREQGTTLAQIPRPQMESLWDQAKLHEQSAPGPHPNPASHIRK